MATSSEERYALLCKVLRINVPLQILDVGANPMNFDPPYKALHEAGEVVVTGFDPQEETLESLTANAEGRDRFLPYAVGDGAKLQLNIYKGSGLTSLLKIRRETLFFLMGLKRAARLIETQDIKTKRLDDLDEVTNVDLLKIDIQGAECMVFTNGKRTLESAVAVHTEVNFFPLYEDQPSFGEVDIVLRQHGFVPHSFYSMVKRMVRSSRMRELRNVGPSHLLDGDIVYFRDLSLAKELSVDNLKRMAMISDGIYGFFDFTLRCIDELEKRNEVEANYIPAYIEALNDR